MMGGEQMSEQNTKGNRGSAVKLFQWLLGMDGCILCTLETPLVSDRAQFRSLLAAAVYLIDCLTASFDCFVLLEYYYPKPVPLRLTFAITL